MDNYRIVKVTEKAELISYAEGFKEAMEIVDKQKDNGIYLVQQKTGETYVTISQLNKPFAFKQPFRFFAVSKDSHVNIMTGETQEALQQKAEIFLQFENKYDSYGVELISRDIAPKKLSSLTPKGKKFVWVPEA